MYLLRTPVHTVKVPNFNGKFPSDCAFPSSLQSWELLASANFGRTLKLGTFCRRSIWRTGPADDRQQDSGCQEAIARDPPYDVVHSLAVSISTLSRLLPAASRTIGKWSYRSARRCLGGLSDGIYEGNGRVPTRREVCPFAVCWRRQTIRHSICTKS